MLFIICFAVSILMLVISVICFFRKSKHKLVITGAVLFIALFAMFLPSESCANFAETANNVVVSTVRAIRVFGLNEDFLASEFNFGDLPFWFNITYIFVLNLLYLLAPLITFSIILSCFGNIYSGIRLLFSLTKDVYIFSESNVRSERLSKDINKDSVAVFFNSDTSVFREKNNVICFSTEITDISLFLIKFIKHATFFICSDDENDNLNTAIKLIKILKKDPKLVKTYSDENRGIDLYVFTSLKKAEPLLNGMDTCGIRVRRINEAQSLIYNFVYNKPVLEYSKGNKEINLAVVGLGHYGEEYLRAAVWSGQDMDCRLNINVFDNRNVSKAFAVKYPELVNTEQLDDKDEINYKINFFDGEENDIFITDHISELKNSNAVFVALGDDEKNFEAAVYLRECFERMGTKPDIYTILFDLDFETEEDENSKINIVNHKNKSYDIDFILPDDIFSYDNIMNIELEKMGKAMFNMWRDKNNTDFSAFYNFGFNYRSSISSSMFWYIRAKVGKKVDDTEENLRLEHRRWNAYMRSEGFRYSSERNDIAKYHNNLVRFDKLEDDIKEYDAYAIRAVKMNGNIE